MTYVPLKRLRAGQTSRQDRWWVKPFLVFCGLTTFVVYSTWAAFQNADYTFQGYLSPFYSPEIIGSTAHAWFIAPEGWPAISPALLILWAPAGFRMTCYYYRGAYYKSHWLSPPACGVGKPHKGYRGEKKLPLIIMNIHRYFLYLALGFLIVLSIDVYNGLWFATAGGGEEFGIGVGTLVLLVNVILLGGYTLGCHSLRHLVGGKKDVMSNSPLRQKVYNKVSCYNAKHQLWAWCSLFWVGFTDLYVRLCATGTISDFRII
mgnify:CR=1 FL=1